jgi:hypothetical protein
MPIVKFKHSGNIGDIIYSLPCVKAMIDHYNYGCKDGIYVAQYLLQYGVGASYMPGVTHPCGNMRMTKEIAEMLSPLFEFQTWMVKPEIADHFGGRDGSETRLYDIDLDEFRNLPITYDHGSTIDWYAWTFAFDKSKCDEQWLSVIDHGGDFLDLPIKHNKIVVGRTSRYRAQILYYDFLASRDDLLFLGTLSEYNDFAQWIPQALYCPVENFLEAAKLIAGARMFVGNQSFFYALAEAIKVPRLLECCPYTPNVPQYGSNAFGAIHSNTMRDYFNLLLEKTEHKPMVFK